MTAGLPPPERDEGPAEADPARTLEPSPESSYVTVTRHRLHDAQGDECLVVELPRDLDDRAGADVVIQPYRCVHLVAAPDTAWTVDGLRRIVWRTALRVPLTFDDVPEPLAAALEAELLAYIDWLTTSAA